MTKTSLNKLKSHKKHKWVHKTKKSPLVLSDSRMYTIKAIFKSQSIICRGICREKAARKAVKNGFSPFPAPPSNIYSSFLYCSAFGYCSKTPETVNFKTGNGFLYLTALAASVGG